MKTSCEFVGIFILRDILYELDYEQPDNYRENKVEKENRIYDTCV
jgi:hypothetical protein